MPSLGDTCIICSSSGWKRLGRHIKTEHNLTQREYYDRCFKKESEGLCLYCGDPTTFHKNEYKKFCPKKECQFKWLWENDTKFRDKQIVHIGNISKENWQKNRDAMLKIVSKATKSPKRTSEVYSKNSKSGWKTGKTRESIAKAREKQWKDLDFVNMMSQKAVERLRDPSNAFGYTKCKTSWYKGSRMRSGWEVTFAEKCDEKNIRWEYEPETFTLSTGKRYTPDFYLPDFDLFIEVKPEVFVEQFKEKIFSVSNVKVITENNFDEFFLSVVS